MTRRTAGTREDTAGDAIDKPLSLDVREVNPLGLVDHERTTFCGELGFAYWTLLLERESLQNLYGSRKIALE